MTISPRRLSAERRREAKEFAQMDIPDAWIPAWKAERSRFNGAPHVQAELFAAWVHDHPAEVIQYAEAEAAGLLDESIAERACIDDRKQTIEDAANPLLVPQQKPGQSEQRVGTPVEYLDWVRAKFGYQFTWDLAANATNTVCPSPRFFGPGSPSGEDAFREPWIGCGEGLWCNPPYTDIGPWVERCSQHDSRQGCIFVLVPASVGSTWWRDFVHGKAHVFFGRRICFVGHTTSYPKDLALCIYGLQPGYAVVDWPSCLPRKARS